MTDLNLSNQQLRQLELLGKGHPVIATWSHQALGDMWRLTISSATRPTASVGRL